MTKPQPVRLVFNYIPGGIHEAAWKFLDDPAKVLTDVTDLTTHAQLAERGGLDAIFVPDLYGGISGSTGFRKPWRSLDPVVSFAAVAAQTSHIGLVTTVSGVYGAPYDVARKISTLDHISRGRAAWNIVTSLEQNALDSLGIDEPWDHDSKYDRTEEFVAAVHALWASFPSSAVKADPSTGLYLDHTAIESLDIRGKNFSVRGPFSVPAFEENKPVIFQAGTSDRSKSLGGRWADAIFTKHRTIESGQRFSKDIKDVARAAGRPEGSVVTLPGLLPIVGATEAEAWRKKDELDERVDLEFLRELLGQQLGLPTSKLDLDRELPYDEISLENLPSQKRDIRVQIIEESRLKQLPVRRILVNNITAGHRVVIGTPEQLADDFIEWVDRGGSDGFAFNVAAGLDSLRDIVDGVVPELQRRGRFRTEYEGSTIRENLGVGPGVR